MQLVNEFNIQFDNGCRIFIDGANPSFVRALKKRVGEDSNYEQLIRLFQEGIFCQL